MIWSMQRVSLLRVVYGYMIARPRDSRSWHSGTHDLVLREELVLRRKRGSPRSRVNGRGNVSMWVPKFFAERIPLLLALKATPD